MTAKRKRSYDRGLCPLLRTVSRNVRGHYIGFLTNKEFNLIDLFLTHEAAFSSTDIATAFESRTDSTGRFLNDARRCGIIGALDIELVPGETGIMQYMYGPTMKGAQLWHASLGEDWDWEYYYDRSWVYNKSVHDRRTAKVAAKSCTPWRVEKH